jgi:transcriptional regulator with XRE-family HTH domain
MSERVNNDLICIGRRIREARRVRELTLDQIARRTGLSKGLLSKIENFRTIPSLPVLAQIAGSLNLDMGELVKGIGVDVAPPYEVIKSADRKVVERDK